MLNDITRWVIEVGLWNGVKSNGIHIIAKFCLFCYMGVFVLQLIDFVLVRNDLDRIFESTSVLFVCGFGFLKLYSLHGRRATWLSLLKQVKELEDEEDLTISVYEYDSDDEGKSNLKYAKLKKKYEEQYKTTSTILYRIYRTSLILFLLSPFVEYGFWSLLGDTPSKYPHILPTWAPLDDVHVAWYITLVLAEAVAACICSGVHIAFDLTFYGVITFMCGQCSVLIEKCADIGGRGSNSMYSRKREERAHFRISYAHKTYIILIKAISTLDDLFRNSFGVYFLVSTVTFCCIALRLKLGSLTIMQMTRLLQYATSIVLQLYLSCTYGDKLFNETSIKMGEGPFCAATWCLSPKISREIVLLSMGMTKPRRIRAGPFNTVNLPSFVQIVRAAYSCYAVVGRKRDEQQ